MSLPLQPATHERLSSKLDQPQLTTNRLDAALEGLQQRELLEPVLLLSAGYVALPFLLRQGLFLLAPLLALCGFVLEREEGGRALPK